MMHTFSTKASFSFTETPCGGADITIMYFCVLIVSACVHASLRVIIVYVSVLLVFFMCAIYDMSYS